MTHPPPPTPWLHRFSVLTALATLGLIGLGGLVTSHEAGMSVPDWPTSYGYNMFALPFQYWTGGVFYEHTHRLWASVVGVLVVLLTRWLGGKRSRLPLAIIGGLETLAGLGIHQIWPGLKGTGYFLSGIGSVVLLVALIWADNPPAHSVLRRLGWTVFGLVQFQGLLGGLRVVLFKDQIGIVHAALAQIFFVLLCAIALLTSRWRPGHRHPMRRRSASDPISVGLAPGVPKLWRWCLFATLLIFLQLLIGATMRHQHAGLAIWDFPLAHGQFWPATDPISVERYNQQRMEISGLNPITAFQVQLQMAHRLMAVLILAAVGFCAWKSRDAIAPVARLSVCWLGLILAQAALGAATVLWNKPADVATAHVLAGALSLATGAVLCMIAARPDDPAGGETRISPAGVSFSKDEMSFAARTSTVRT